MYVYVHALPNAPGLRQYVQPLRWLRIRAEQHNVADTEFKSQTRYNLAAGK